MTPPKIEVAEIQRFVRTFQYISKQIKKVVPAEALKQVFLHNHLPDDYLIESWVNNIERTTITVNYVGLSDKENIGTIEFPYMYFQMSTSSLLSLVEAYLSGFGYDVQFKEYEIE